MTEEIRSETTAFIPIHEPKTGRLLFRYDPTRHLIEIQRRGIKTVVDLSRYHPPDRMEGRPRQTDVCS